MASTEPPGILVVARGHIGDLVLATPALRDIRQHYPSSHIAVLVNEYSAEVLDRCPYVDEVIAAFAYESKGSIARWWNTARLLRGLRGRFDIVISLWYAPPTMPLIGRLIGARQRVGFDLPGRWSRLLTASGGFQPTDLPVRVANTVPPKLLGVDTSPEYTPVSWAATAVRSSVDALLAGTGLEERRFAVLQVSCDWGCNELASAKWAPIINRLWTDHELRSAVVGLDDRFERAKLDEIESLTEHPPVSLLGRTTLPELLEVVRRSALVVSTDSALTQVALAQAVPAVIAFGIEPTIYNGPLPSELNRMEVVQHWPGPDLAPPPNPHCQFYSSYCHTEHCRENSSLVQTTVDEMMSRIVAVLERAADQR